MGTDRAAPDRAIINHRQDCITMRDPRPHTREATRIWQRARDGSGLAPCEYCGDYRSRRDLTGDHVVPRSKGGRVAGNIALACRPCNETKADHDAAQFREWIASDDGCAWVRLGLGRSAIGLVAVSVCGHYAYLDTAESIRRCG
jgi:5-methylcytosine-specific restriction endonuclease McrA